MDKRGFINSIRAVLLIALTACLFSTLQGCSSDEAKYRKYKRALRSYEELKTTWALQTNNPVVSHKSLDPELTPEERRRNQVTDLLILGRELEKSGYVTNATFVVTNLAFAGAQITNRLNAAFKPRQKPASLRFLIEENRVEVICRTRDLPLVEQALMDNQK